MFAAGKEREISFYSTMSTHIVNHHKYNEYDYVTDECNVVAAGYDYYCVILVNKIAKMRSNLVHLNS